jgi:hypothetical protein
MKKLCPDCKSRFEVNLDDHDEGDALTCPECNLEFTIVSDRTGKFKLVESKDIEMDGLDETELEASDDYDYD